MQHSNGIRSRDPRSRGGHSELLVALLGLLFASGVPIPAAAVASLDSIIGHWEGAYVRLGAVQTVSIDLSEGENGLVGTYDVPDLSIYGEPVTEIDYHPPVLSMRLKYGVYTMQVHPEVEEMTGENARWNPPVRLHLKRVVRDPSQPYVLEEARFRNGSVELHGTLFKPLRQAPYPAMVVVQGSGEQGRKTYYYRFWGDFLARHGVAALIYDKRGVGASTGDFRTGTFQDLAGDAASAVRWLAGHKEVDSSRIGLFGISQGGWIAPMVAESSPDVHYLILDVGPAVSVEEQELNRVEYTMRADDVPQSQIDQALDYTRWAFHAAYTGDGRDQLEQRLREARASKWSQYVQLIESNSDLEDWKRIRYDPEAVLQKTTIPILCLFGEKDLLVPPATNENKMERYLRAAGNQDVTIKVIPNVGHDMESFATLEGGAWEWPGKYWVWAKKSQRFYQAIVDWLTSHGLTGG